MKTIHKHTTYLEEAKVNVAKALNEYNDNISLSSVILLRESVDHLHKLLIVEKWLKEHSREDLTQLQGRDV